LSRGWPAALAALAAIRVAIPLAALAASGEALPGLPRYEYAGLTGDATGFYAATREFIASWGRLGAPLVLLLVFATVATAVGIVVAWRRCRARPAWIVVSAAAVFALVVSAAVTQMHPPGAAVFGWPLVWSLPMLPYRALGGPLDPDVAFGFGLVLSLAANAVTVVATAYAGLYATGRRALGVAAAAAYALWPLLVGVVGGERAWGNGTWTVDAGLALYTEPLSTALVTTALALLLSPRLTDFHLSLAGAALGLATVVKLSNGLLAAVALGLVAVRLGTRRSLPFVAAALPFAVVVATYWPKGYAREELLPDDPFALRYAADAWTDSLLFGPRTLAVLLPPAILGAIALKSGWARALLGGWIVVTAIVYSFYRVTPQHPRFLFAVLPAVLVLWTVGAATVVRHLRAYTAQSPARMRT
jgi:hypothetical protein